MKTYKQLIEDSIEWLVPDYPEQILSKDDPEGNWVTGDSPKPIEFPPTENTPSEQHSSTSRILKKVSALIKREREAGKPKGNTK